MMQFEYFNARLLQNTALKIKETVGAVTPPAGYAFGVLSALTNLEIASSDLVENVNSVYVNTLDIKIPTEETMVEYIEYVFEHDAAKRDSVIIKSNTIPAASAELLGYEYQYMGETNNTYTHGFVYVCKGIPADTLVFTPNTVSCDWADLSAFLQTETADYNSVVAGSMTYFADAELWRATFTDANGDTVLTYQQYTGDWENVGFVFSQTFADGDVVSFVRYTESDYVWERVDLQPNHEQDIIEIREEIEDLKGLGRFLSVWNCATGLAETNPPESPYTYHTGDYFLVGTIGSTNYKPNGSTYTTGVPSTTVETAVVKVSDVYIYDGTNWKLQANSQRDVTFSGIVGNPYDNTALATALNEKQNTISDLATIRSYAQAGKTASDTIATYGNIVTHNVSEFATAAQGAKADTAVQPGDLATVATTGSYNDLSDKPTIPTVNNPTITITQGGVTKGSFALNQATGDTIALDAGGGNATWGNISGTLSNQTDLKNALDAKQATITGAATTIASSDLATARAVISNSAGKIATSTVTSTELGYLHGATSSIQDQLNLKPNASSLADVAFSGYYSDLLYKPTIPADISAHRINGAPLSNSASVFYGISDTAAATVQKEVSIPSITTLDVGTVIIVKPTVTSAVANSTIKLNNFSAYPMRYNNAAITTSTDSIVWNATYPSVWVFDGTYWLFVAHGIDSNTTYSAMSVAEGTTGTATSNRVLQAVNLKQIIQGTTLTGIDVATTGAVSATDTITGGIGKLQATKANKSELPTVNNPTITITQGGITKGSFTLNQAAGDTIALDAGGGGGSYTAGDGIDITNDVISADKTTIIGWGMPDYDARVSFSNNTNYTAPSDGFVMASGYSSTSTNSDFYLNGTRMASFVANTSAWLPAIVYCPVRKGDIIKINFTQGTFHLNFYPLKGV